MKVTHRLDAKDYIEVLPEGRIKFKDVFTLKEVYTQMHDWLVEQGYAEPPYDHFFPEVFYNQKWVQNAGEEYRWWWRCTKPGNSKLITYEVDINVLGLGFKSTEVMMNGKKFVTNTGEMDLKISARLLLDKDGAWRNHWFLRHIFPIMKERILPVNQERENLLYDTRRLLEFLKQHLGIKHYQPEPEGQQMYANAKFE